MTSTDFQKELQDIDPRFQVVENMNRPGLSNILFDGKNYDLPVLSTHNIKDEADPSYRYEFPNGITARHHSRPEILDRIHDFLKKYNSGTFKGLHDEE